MVPAWGPPLLQGGASVPLPPPPPPPPPRPSDTARLPSEAAQPQQGSSALYCHSFSLEVPKDESTPRGIVFVRLLGPFSAKCAHSLPSMCTLITCLPCIVLAVDVVADEAAPVVSDNKATNCDCCDPGWAAHVVLTAFVSYHSD